MENRTIIPKTGVSAPGYADGNPGDTGGMGTMHEVVVKTHYTLPETFLNQKESIGSGGPPAPTVTTDLYPRS